MGEDAGTPIRDDVWNDLIEMIPSDLKNRGPLVARWGSDTAVEELVEAGHLAVDGGRVTRTKASVDAAALWEILPEDGSTIGNQRARGHLGWKSEPAAGSKSRDRGTVHRPVRGHT